MHALRRGFLPLVLLVAVVGSWSCDNDDTTNPSFDPQEVEAGAVAATLTGPSAEASEQMILAMVAELSGPAPLSVGAQTTGCTSFDLGNGITGNCTEATGVYTLTFGGTVAVDSDTVSVQGTLVVTPAIDQPVEGTRYLIDFDATASSPRGEATWSAAGTVTVDVMGAVTAYDFTMTHTVTPTGGPSVVATVFVSPTSFQLLITGPLGNTLRFALDRESMTGTVAVNGNDVASIAIVEGCATIDFFDDALADTTVCSEGRA